MPGVLDSDMYTVPHISIEVVKVESGVVTLKITVVDKKGVVLASLPEYLLRQGDALKLEDIWND